MNIETKYSLGDKVWKINREMPRVWRPCAFCGGTEKYRGELAPSTEVTGMDGSKRCCPKCHGRGGGWDYLELAWNVGETLYIGQVRFEASDDGEKESYMEDARGGYVHYVDTLYPTKKEAQAECDRRNDE